MLAVAAGAFVALAAPATGRAQSECGKQVLQDWSDNGRVDKLYRLHCYEDAIDQIPKDLAPYVDAEQVISRALSSALNDELAPGGCDPTPDRDDTDLCRGIPGGAGNNNGGAAGGPEAAPEVDSTGATSIPVPLLVLGGMSVALLAAGGLGYLSRRRLSAETTEPDDDFEH
jgi:hypothetical protein